MAKKYHLTNKAVEDLSDIWEYTLDAWSERQADAYYNMLIGACQKITENPQLLNTNKQNTNELNTDINIATSNEVPPTPEKQKTKSFKKPTLEEIKEYCKERNNSIDPEHFYDYYESNGWTVGRNKMKDWKATIRNWEKNEKSWNKPKYKNNNPLSRQEEEWSEKLNNMTKEEIDNLF